jgi:streptomycin 3"-adenylyltransferase
VVPDVVRPQLDELADGLLALLGADLGGLYLHGSIALSCFNSARSDIDAIALTARPLSDDERFAVADLFLRISARPYAIEAHLVTTEQLRRWRYPPPYDFHYGESHRERLALDPAAPLGRPVEGDPDLAAHYDVVRAVGIALVGPPPRSVFPEVPPADLEDALRRDFEWCRGVRSALYGVLSPCRIWAALGTGELHSKTTGAEWALTRLPTELRPPVERALDSYRGAGEPIELDEAERQRLLTYIEQRLPSSTDGSESRGSDPDVTRE